MAALATLQYPSSLWQLLRRHRHVRIAMDLHRQGHTATVRLLRGRTAMDLRPGLTAQSILHRVQVLARMGRHISIVVPAQSIMVLHLVRDRLPVLVTTGNKQKGIPCIGGVCLFNIWA